MRVESSGRAVPVSRSSFKTRDECVFVIVHECPPWAANRDRRGGSFLVVQMALDPVGTADDDWCWTEAGLATRAVPSEGIL